MTIAAVNSAMQRYIDEDILSCVKTSAAQEEEVGQGTFCNFKTSLNFGEYVRGNVKKEYYEKDCPHVLPRFKKCNSIGYVWEPPKDCELVKISDFIEYYRNRTLIFWGDSLTDQFAGSMMCMLGRRDKWSRKSHYEFAGKLETRRFCLRVRGDIEICFILASTPKHHLGAILKFFEKGAVVIANFGMHYNKEKIGRDEIVLGEDIDMLSRSLMRINSSTFIWRETSFQHFPTNDGTFKHSNERSKKRTVCKAISGVPFSWRNNITTPIIKKVTPHIIRLGQFTSSIPPSLHRGGGDCTHYCNPGVTDDWVRILMNYIYVNKI